MSRLLVVLGLLSSAVNSETLNCGRRCGPCRHPNEMCTMRCLGYESCKEGHLTCSPATGRSDQCTIDCRADKSCLSAQIQATTVYSELSINCLSPQACDSLHVYAASGVDVFINCNADKSCTDLYLAAFDARDVFINCVGEGSCEGLRMECGTGSCLLNCLNNLGGVCHHVNLGCGRSPRCQINCRGHNKCDGMQVNAVSAIGFQCIGDPLTECLGAPVPFMLPTRAPSKNPTQVPTSSPTFSPTGAPTDSPTLAPTLAPTDNPTLAPTTDPTQIPTAEPSTSPTLRPTNNPSTSPTLLPSASPSVTPSTSPTFGPSIDPTSDPTTAAPSFPTSSPTYPTRAPTEEIILMNTAIDNRNNAVNRNGDGLIASLGSNPTEMSLIVICAIFAFCIICCIPLLCCVYRQIRGKPHFQGWFINDGKRRMKANDDDDDEDDDDDDRHLHPAAPMKSYDMEGDYVPQQNLQRLASKSVTKDGYSSQFGFASNSVTVPLSFTNSRPPRRRGMQQAPMHSVDELEYGDSSHAGNNTTFMSDAEMTQNIVKVSIWFIENVKLPQYCELFVLNGFTTMEAIESISEMAQLEMLGIERADHRYQIMREIHMLGGGAAAAAARGQARRRGHPSAMPSDSDDVLEDGAYDMTGDAMGLASCPSKNYMTPALSAPRRKAKGGKSSKLSKAKKAGKGKGKSNKGKKASKAERAALEMVAPPPRDTLGIPPEFAHRVRVIQDGDGSQVWQIDDVMEQDLVEMKKKKKKRRQQLSEGGNRDRVQVENGSEDSDNEDTDDEEQEDEAVLDGGDRIALQQSAAKSQAVQQVEEEEDEDEEEEDESDLMLKMENNAQNPSISDSSLFRAFRNNMVE